MSKLGEACQHGSLRRSCAICQRDEEITQLRLDVAGLRSAMQQLAAKRHALEAEVSRLREIASRDPNDVGTSADPCEQ